MAWKELGILIGVLVVWFSLMRFVLPALGLPTCMSGACRVGGGGACPMPAEPFSDGAPAPKPSLDAGSDEPGPDSSA